MDDLPGRGLRMPAEARPADPRCGASPECLALYHEVAARELSDPALADLHQLTVDTYAAQHTSSGSPAIGTAFALGMTHGLGHGPDSGDEHAIFAARPLTVADLDAIAEATARKVVEIVSPPAATTFAFVSARELARELGVQLDYVYSHAAELGGMRLGSGRRARIRVDLDRVRRTLEAPRHRGSASRSR